MNEACYCGWIENHRSVISRRRLKTRILMLKQIQWDNKRQCQTRKLQMRDEFYTIFFSYSYGVSENWTLFVGCVFVRSSVDIFVVDFLSFNTYKKAVFIQKRVNCLLIQCLFSCKSFNFSQCKIKWSHLQEVRLNFHLFFFFVRLSGILKYAYLI